MNGWERFNTAAYWLMRAAYINILWALFTIVGLGIFGFFPATVAMFSISRQWLIKKDTSLHVFREFWRVYKQEFFPANGHGGIFLILGYILYIDVTFLLISEGWVRNIWPIAIILGIMYVSTLIFYFPIKATFHLGFFGYIRQAFFVALASPLQLFIILLTFVAMAILIYVLPGLLPMFGGSVPAFVITYLTAHTLEKARNKKTSA
ncbi:YesL family protein [Salimicrobium halophilum]|uniref:Uncharacterized membrane protein YesL n=1 Tax=Salimicrobium halophilum TaxID=86666 RepID=A0A1G8S9H3_9BACI|nr:DUF624 domain-containing protein [Salimicrobium halophilum]SDJ25859.1 Uncharacterized membrane protein YesL [Salimicrobium halophilum]